MRALFVTDSIRPLPTGTGRMALAHLRGLVERGVEVVPVDHEPNPIAAAAAGRDVIVLPIAGTRFRTARWHLDLPRRAARAGIAFDVAIDPSGFPDRFGVDRRWAVFLHDLSMHRRGFYRPGKRLWFRLWHRAALRRAGMVLCVSRHTADAARAELGLDAARLAVVPNPIDPAIPVAEALPKGLAGRRFALVLGMIEARKNPQRLIDALAGWPTTAPALELVFAGRIGTGGAGALADARARGLGVHHVDRPDDATVAALFAHARLLAFPSLDEGFGLPILEAFRAGVPVLTSNVTAMPEVAGDAAVLVDPYDVGALRDAMVRLDGDAALRARLIAAGRARLHAFAPAATTALLLDALAACRNARA